MKTYRKNNKTTGTGKNMKFWYRNNINIFLEHGTAPAPAPASAPIFSVPAILRAVDCGPGLSYAIASHGTGPGPRIFRAGSGPRFSGL
jgi:hypothetical protein